MASAGPIKACGVAGVEVMACPAAMPVAPGLDGSEAGLEALEELPSGERDAILVIDPSLETDIYAKNELHGSELQGIVLGYVEAKDVGELANLESQVAKLRARSDSLEASTEQVLGEAYDVFNDTERFKGLHERLLNDVFNPEDENAPKVGMSLGGVCKRLGAPEAGLRVAERFKAMAVNRGGPIGVKALAAKIIEERKLDDTFYFIDLGNVQRLYNAWHRALPRVQPYYAVKCNPDPSVIAMLAANGCGFDCASAKEIQLVMEQGVPVDRIIYAHPAKAQSDLRFAAQVGVKYTTFDSMVELKKIAKLHKDCQLVLRIRADDPGAAIAFGVKYGAMRNEYERFLNSAKELGLEVVGVSFHVGSMAKNASAFYEAIKEARLAFDTAVKCGHSHMRLLDIGGGFVGRFDSNGEVLSMQGDIPLMINRALDEFFGPATPFAAVKVISEPGRYFAEGSMHLCCIVHSWRERKDADGNDFVDYVLSDGLYGSFNAVLYDGARPRGWLLYDPLNIDGTEEQDQTLVRSNVYGPTCDSMDCVYKNVMLPSNMDVGDWLVFPYFGAYTVAGATNFNGIMAAQPLQVHIVSEALIDDKVVIMWTCEMQEKPSPIVA